MIQGFHGKAGLEEGNGRIILPALGLLGERQALIERTGYRGQVHFEDRPPRVMPRLRFTPGKKGTEELSV